MAAAILWMIISIAVLVIILGILAALLVMKRGKKHKTDYYAFFIIGIIWTAFGAIFWDSLFFFMIIGIVFMVIGLANRDKWKSNRRKWKDMDSKERKLMLWVVVILGMLVLVGLIAFFLFEKGII